MITLKHMGRGKHSTARQVGADKRFQSTLLLCRATLSPPNITFLASSYFFSPISIWSPKGRLVKMIITMEPEVGECY